MKLIRTASLLLLVLPLAACGNKGPLILAPKPQEAPEMPAGTVPAESMPADAASAMPAPAVSVGAGAPVAPPTEGNDGTPGKPR